MPTPKKQEEKQGEINEDELIGYIMRNTRNHNLTYQQVEAVLQAEGQFMVDNGFMDSE